MSYYEEDDNELTDNKHLNRIINGMVIFVILAVIGAVGWLLYRFFKDILIVELQQYLPEVIGLAPFAVGFVTLCYLIGYLFSGEVSEDAAKWKDALGGEE